MSLLQIEKMSNKSAKVQTLLLLIVCKNKVISQGRNQSNILWYVFI